MKTNKINPRVLLSTLWIIILFNMIVRDLHDFLREGSIERMMSINIAEETMLFYGVIAQIPILMILLSRILSDKANKWSNTLAVVVTALGLLSTLPSADMDDIWFVCTGTTLLVVILRVAWKLPHPKKVITS